MDNSSKKTLISLPDITVNYQAELMQNYVAETAIDVGKGLKSLKFGTDDSIIFFIDNSGVLTAIISSSGTGSGWQIAKISDAKYQVSSFDFYYDEESGHFRLSFAQINQGKSELKVSQEITIDSFVNLNNLASALNSEAIVLDHTNRLINQISMDSKGVLFSSMAKDTDAQYHYFIYGNKPEVFILPENTGRVKQLKVGVLFGFYGVFVLYDMPFDKRTLVFQSFLQDGETEIIQRRFDIDDTIECFDILPDSDGNSVIYVAGKGIFRYETHESDKEEIAASEIRYTQIDVSQDMQEISIWVVGEKHSNKGLYYITNQYHHAQHSEGKALQSNWSTPIQMHADISDFSSIRGKHFANQLFLFGKASDGNKGLIHFWQDRVSTNWQENRISLDDLNSVIEIESYTVDLDFIPKLGTEKIFDQIYISAEENTILYINNIKYYITVGNRVPVDFQSSVNIIYPVDSLAAPAVTISASFLPNSIEIDPSKGIRAILQDTIKSGADLLALKRPDGSPLLKQAFTKSEVDEVATILKQVLDESDRLNTKTSTPAPRHQTGILAATLLPQGEYSFFSELGYAMGDLWYSVKQGFTKITNFIVEKVGAVVTFVIEVGGKIVRWVVDKIKSAVSFLERVFEKLKVFFKDLYETLAFAFDWDDIITTKRALKQIGLNYLEEAKLNIDSYKEMAVSYILDLRAKYEKLGKAIDQKYLKSANLLDMMADNAKKESVDSRTNWLNSKKDVAFGAEAKLQPGSLEEGTEKTILSEAKENGVPSDMGDLLIQLLKGQIGFGEFIEKFANKLVLLALDVAKKITELIFDLLFKTVDFLGELLYTAVNIPILSYLYKKLAKDDLSVADLVALVIAIPVTVGYKLAHNEAPFKKEDQNFINSFKIA